MLEYMGTVENGSIKMDDEQPLPEGARVKVVLDPVKPTSTLGERLMRLAGTANDLPEDMAAEHDHYLHGTPRRNSKVD